MTKIETFSPKPKTVEMIGNWEADDVRALIADAMIILAAKRGTTIRDQLEKALIGFIQAHQATGGGYKEAPTYGNEVNDGSETDRE